jgi:hypothetical protein
MKVNPIEKPKVKVFYLYPYDTQRHIFSTRKPMTFEKIRYYLSQMVTFAFGNPMLEFKIVVDDYGSLTTEQCESIRQMFRDSKNVRLRFK